MRIINGDWVVEQPTIIESETVVVNGDMYVNADLEIRNTSVLAGDLVVNKTYTIDAGSETDMQSWNCSGEYEVIISKTGTLEVYGKLWNNPNDIYYNFYVYGNLTVDHWIDPLTGKEYIGSISEVNGNLSDLSQPGGIIAKDAVGKVKILNGGTIYNCRAHALWIDNSKAEIYDAVIRDAGGDGIVAVNGAVVDVEGANISWNGRYGINVDNAYVYVMDYGGKNTTVEWNRMDGIHVENLDANMTNAYGKPDYTAGSELGYFVWWDENGWHLARSSDGSSHRFNGTVITEHEMRTFDSTFSVGQEVSDFGHSKTVIFDLWLDGARQPAMVFTGEDSENPFEIPFTLMEIRVKDLAIRNAVISNNFASGIYLENTSVPVEGNEISHNGQVLRFSDDFEEDAGWQATGLWQRVYNGTKINGTWTTPAWNISHSGNWSWWYGYEHDVGGDLTGDYDTGSRNYGNLTSPVIDIRDATSATLTFWSWYETDTTGTDTDRRWVIIHNDTIESRIQLSGEPMGEWIRYVVDISAFAGKNMTVRFYFDTINEIDNAHQGWYVDDIEVIMASPPIEGHGIYCTGDVPLHMTDNIIYENNWNGVFLYAAENLVAENNRIYLNDESSLYIEESRNIRIDTNYLHHSARGAYLHDCTDISLIGNSVYNNGISGIELANSDNNMIFDNTVWGHNTPTGNTKPGIYIRSYSNNNNIAENNVYENDRNIELGSGSNNVFGNTVHDTLHGIRVRSSSNSIHDNSIYSCRLEGIWIMAGHDNQVYSNNISGNTYAGVFLHSVSNNYIYGNNISLADAGILIYSYQGSSKENRIFNNNIYSCTYGVEAYAWYVGNTGKNIIENNTLHENDYGIYVSYKSNFVNNRIANNTIAYNKYDGIYMKSSGAQNDICLNNISYNGGNGITSYMSNISIFQNDIFSNGNCGIWVDVYDIIYNNNISETDTGVCIHGSDSVLFSNRIWNSVYGIYTSSGSSPEIYSNSVWNSTYGMYLEGMPWVHENSVWNCTYGIYTENMPATDTTRTRVENLVNGNETESLTFSGPGDDIVYFSVPERSKILSVSFDITGAYVAQHGTFYTRTDHSGTLVEGTAISGDPWTPGRDGYMAYFGAYLRSSDSSGRTYTAHLYRDGQEISNYTVTSDGAEKWENFHFPMEIFETGTYQVTVTSSNAFLWYTGSNGQFAQYASGTLYFYPTYLRTDMGNDGDTEYSYNDELKNTVTLSDSNTSPNLTLEMQEYVDGASADSSGMVRIPLRIHSGSAGILNLSDIHIEYSPPVLVENNEVRENLYGIYIGGNTEVLFIDNRVYTNREGVYSESDPLIRGNDVYNNTEVGVFLDAFSGTMSYNFVHDNEYGVYVKNSTGVLENNDIYGHRHIGYETGAGGQTYSYYYGYGLSSENSNVEIRSNHIYGNEIGVIVSSSSASRIEDNILENNHNKAMIAEKSSNILFLNNTLFGSKFGIYLQSTDSIEISRNSFDSMLWFGVRGLTCNNSLFTENTASGPWGADAISVYQLTNSTIERNTFEKSGGIRIRSASSHNVIRDNKISAVQWGGIGLTDSYNNAVESNEVWGLTPTSMIYALSSHSSRDNLFANNTLRNVTIGIYVSGSSGEQILENTVRDLSEPGWLSDYAGIYITDSTDICVERNLVANSVFGINIENSGVAVENNTINGNKLSGIVMGVSPLEPERSVKIYSNLISGNGYDGGLISDMHGRPDFSDYPMNSGIEIWGGNATIERNTVTGNNGSGICITGDDNRGYFRPFISDNNISGNGMWGIEARYEAPLNEDPIVDDNTWATNNTNGRFVQKWRIRIRATLDGTAQAGSTVWIKDRTDTEVWRGTTDENGYTPCVAVVEYFFDSDGVKHVRTPHTIYASYTDASTTYYGSEYVVIDRNMDEIVVSMSS